MFMNLAHRGASHYAPENTLTAFYKGLEMGATGLETDLRLTKDGVIFLLHDDRLDRTTNGTGSHSDYTWKEIQKLDAGSWFSPFYSRERLVSLDTFIHQFEHKPIQIALELKEAGMEEEVVAVLHKHDLLRKVTVTSFEYSILREVRRLDEQANIGYLVRYWDDELKERLKEIKAQQVCPRADTVTEESVRLAKREGFVVRAWGVKDEQLMYECLRSGVDGMTINFPDKLHHALNGVI
jgi:glycerophosphoryl diester phosphodiesterase